LNASDRKRKDALRVAQQPTEFGGEEHFAASQERLYALLTDLDAMAATIPDLVSSEKVDAQTLKCVVRPGFSFLRGTMRLAITLVDCQPSQRATMRVDSQGIGMGLVVVSDLEISPEPDGSRLDWSARIESRRGLISAVSPALIRGAADQVIRHAWTQVRKQLGEA
jgi:carbon monoxide dehydrogenase subunit G